MRLEIAHGVMLFGLFFVFSHGSAHALSCNGIDDVGSRINEELRVASTDSTEYILPAGLCLTSVTIVVPSEIKRIRAAKAGSILRATPNSSASPLIISIMYSKGLELKGITFDGDAPQQALSPVGLQVFRSQNVIFDGIRLRHTRGIGLLFSESSQSGVRASAFEDVGNAFKRTSRDQDQHQGVAFCCGSRGTGNFVTDSYFSDIGLDAVSATQQKSFLASDLSFRDVGGRYSQGGAAIYIAESEDVRVTNNDIEGAFGNGIDIYKAQSVLITHNQVYRAGGTGISLFITRNCIITDNIVFNSNQSHLGAAALNSGISVGGVSNRISISRNVSSDNQNPPTQQFGLLMRPKSQLEEIDVIPPNIFHGNAVGPTNFISR